MLRATLEGINDLWYGLRNPAMRGLRAEYNKIMLVFHLLIFWLVWRGFRRLMPVSKREHIAPCYVWQEFTLYITGPDILLSWPHRRSRNHREGQQRTALPTAPI